MKSKLHVSSMRLNSFNRLAPGLAVGSLLGFMALATPGFAGENGSGFTAHEWGTFTSVQGGDGKLLSWRPLESSRLPTFVHDWRRPGLNRQVMSQLAPIKGDIVALQRMETPVIYFYTDEPQTVDVSVKFPQGLITEWFPQANKIGPSALVAQSAPRVDFSVLDCSTPTVMQVCSTIDGSLKESGATWSQVKLLPLKNQPQLPIDQSGSHYFEARETDANILQVNTLSTRSWEPEVEKFLFYRGVGNFTAPLHVTMDANSQVTLSNTGSEQLSDLFLVTLENNAGKFIRVSSLQPGEERTLNLSSTGTCAPEKEVSSQLRESMAEALTKQGLFQREATAMVKTWADSWFAEDGVRVLYLLPRAWTDRTLPLAFQPAPRNMVRVMVGRAEILSPAREKSLSNSFVQAQRGDAQARESATEELKRLGRFAEPALQLATKDVAAEISKTARALYQTAVQQPTKPL
jgi:hypothetical protein